MSCLKDRALSAVILFLKNQGENRDGPKLKIEAVQELLISISISIEPIPAKKNVG